MHRRTFLRLLLTTAVGSFPIRRAIVLRAFPLLFEGKNPFGPRCVQDRTHCCVDIRCLMTTTTTTDQSSAEAFDQRNEEGARFGRFWIPAASIFLQTPHSVAFVNLRPIVPGHVLVLPRRVVPHLRDLHLDTGEYDDLWRTVRTVQAILSQRYSDATDFNVAVQDGPGAGQSVPHVHVHILPRRTGDLARNDDIYDALERWAPRDEGPHNRTTADRTLHVPADEDRRDRTAAEMAAEAEEYRQIVAADDNASSDP
jgi:bis(5'-adenosyl)-triphosphatase